VTPVINNSTVCNAPALPAIDPAFTRVVNVSTMAAAARCAARAGPASRVEILVTRAGRDLVAMDFMVVNY
jgi:hypothetical protein